MFWAPSFAISFQSLSKGLQRVTEHGCSNSTHSLLRWHPYVPVLFVPLAVYLKRLVSRKSPRCSAGICYEQLCDIPSRAARNIWQGPASVSVQMTQLSIWFSVTAAVMDVSRSCSKTCLLGKELLTHLETYVPYFNVKHVRTVSWNRVNETVVTRM